jgi:hypothetical protein
MRRLYAWVAGAAGGLAAYRALKSRQQATACSEAPPSPAQPDARAEELKARLAQAREAAGAEAPAEDAAPLDPAARRAQVHEQGRAAIEAMHGNNGSSG